jgi:hypothetical protein
MGELRARLAAGTPGPWVAYFTKDGDPYVTVPDRPLFGANTWPDNDRSGVHHTAVSTAPPDYGKANAELIAAAVTALPGLLDEIVRLRRLLALAAEHVPDDCDHHDEIREALR